MTEVMGEGWGDCVRHIGLNRLTQSFCKDPIERVSGGSCGGYGDPASSRQHPLFGKAQANPVTASVVAGEAEQCADRLPMGHVCKAIEGHAPIARPAIGKSVTDVQRGP